MNNRNWIALFFGLACLALLIGVFAVSDPIGNAGNNTTTPQPINQNLMTTPPNTTNTPTKINANDIVNNTTTPDGTQNNTTNQGPDPNNANNPENSPNNMTNGLNMPQMPQ